MFVSQPLWEGTWDSPLEMSAGKKLGKPAVSMFGSCVLAELPDSVKEPKQNAKRGRVFHPYRVAQRCSRSRFVVMEVLR